MDLIFGNTYVRKEIHRAFGGNPQGGISPTKTSNKIFIFSNNAGVSHGYEDGWDDAGTTYYYTGAGQVGDQDLESNRHNGRLLHHEDNGDEVLLFTGVDGPGGIWRYICNLTVVDYEWFQTHDSNRENRMAIRFILERTVKENHRGKHADRVPKKRQIEPKETERRGLVTSRVGQGYYRHLVKDRYEGRCAVTGLNREELLIASHIVPWRDATDEERLDVDNGILLSPAYDALFDKHLISFSDDGSILISEKLSNADKVALKISGSESIEVFPGMRSFLSRHRKELLR